jgi:hypothetical protein
MKRVVILATLISTLFVNCSSAQIFEADSTVQVVGYWSKNDKQSFLLTSDKYSVEGKDTTDREIIKTEIDITVLDSTATSYTVEWLYKTIQSNTDNAISRKFYPLAQNVRFVIKTDEMGSVQELVNVKELQDYSIRLGAALKKDLKGTPGIDEFVEGIQSSFASREAIENDLMEEIYQFYFFHGGKYKLDEPVELPLQLPNQSGGKPIDAEMVIQLTEINVADDNYVMRSSQLVDKQQATEATYQYLKQNNEIGPDFTRDQMPEVVIEEVMSTTVHVSGWTTYSFKTKTVMTGDSAEVHEWTIELQ